jgi:hypothetical protein
MELPFSSVEATMIMILLLSSFYYAGHWIGFKAGAIATIDYFKDEGMISFEEEIIEEDSMNKLVELVEQWHVDRNLILDSTDKDQVCKLIQEVGELSDNVCKERDIADDIGDIIVVLINLAYRNGLSLEHCLEVAYHDIKDRKGKMVDGVFVKESDGV